MKNVTLYTDGACSGNPGVGGWGCVLIYRGVKKEFSAAEDNTTNNRMELMAVIAGLEKLKEPCEVDVYSDSAYVTNAFLQNWISGWVLNSWRGADKKEVKNKDLWQRLYNLTATHKVSWHKVKGHADNELNNRCDELATTAVKEFKK